jgi:hypothetical protein
MYDWYYSALRTVNHLSSWEWFAVLLGVVGLGLFCMRGFGSRTNY